MPATLRSFTQAQTNASTTLSLTVPSDAEGGDWLILMVSSTGGSLNTSLPAGWATLLFHGSSSNVFGRVLVKRAAGLKGSASTDAGTTVTMTSSSSSAVLGYLAVVKGGTAVRVLNYVYSGSSSSATVSPRYTGSRALNLYFGAARVATSTVTASRGTVQHQYTSLASHGSVFATEATPVTSTSMTFTAAPSGTAGIFAAALAVTDDVPTQSIWDRSTTGSWFTAVQFATTARSFANTITSTYGGLVTGVWVYVGQSTMFGQPITVGIYPSTSASVPSATVDAVMQSSVGWQRIPLPTPVVISAGQTFNLVCYASTGRIWRLTNTNTTGSADFRPQAASDFTVDSAKASSSGPLIAIDNPTTSSTTTVYYIDLDYLPNGTIGVTGGGNADGTPQYPADMVVTGGGRATIERATLAAVSGGGGAEIVAWQTEFPAPDAEDLPDELTDPADYDEPEVLQTTFVMPDPVTFFNGVPVDWEPEVP